MDGARSPAPDLFTALAWGSRLAPEPGEDGSLPDHVPQDRPTVPELPVIAGPPPRRRPSAVVVDSAIPAVTVVPTGGLPPPGLPPPASAAASDRGFSPLADLLEPDVEVPASIASEPLDANEFDDLLGALDDPMPVVVAPVTTAPPRGLPRPTALPPPRRSTPVGWPSRPFGPDLPGPGGGTAKVVERRPAAPPSFPAPGDPAESGQLVGAEMSASAAVVSRVAPLVPVPIDDGIDLDEPTRSGGNAWAWVALSVMLAGALGWVLWTQTDLFSGDVLGKRDAEALAAAEAELAARKAENEAKQAEYGMIQIESTPYGARVFDVRPGPEARFEGLPITHEYMVLVTAPGFVPRVRTVKGTELSAPVVVDLDPLAAGATAPPIPEAAPPRLADVPGKDLSALVLRSNTKDAQLALLVGYTPGARLLDVDVGQPRRLWVVLAGHETAELTVKGRHYDDDADGNPVYAESVTLTPSAEVPATDDAEIVVDGEGAPAGAAVPAVPPAAVTAVAPTPPKAPAKKKKKKKKKKKRR